LCNNSEIYNIRFVTLNGDIDMSCPLFEDSTRRCRTRFNDIIQINSYDICELDGYKKCPFYRVINEIDVCCKYVEACMSLRLKDTGGSVPYEAMVQVGEIYCFTANNVNCAVYKLREAGKDVPIDISPDGSKIEMKT